MRRWRPLHRMCGSMEAEYEVQRHHQEGGADGFPTLCQEIGWTHQGACGNNGMIDGL